MGSWEDSNPQWMICVSMCCALMNEAGVEPTAPALRGTGFHRLSLPFHSARIRTATGSWQFHTPDPVMGGWCGRTAHHRAHSRI